MLAGLVVIVTLLITATALVVSVRLYARSPLDRGAEAVAADALPRLAFLREALDDGAGEQMQQLFPEGYPFSHVLYGLTWLEVGRRDQAQQDQALAEAGWAPFADGLTPAYGVFYVGWTSWLRGGVIQLAGGPVAAPDHAGQFFHDTEQLAEAFSASLQQSGSPFLTAYPGQAWPVDNVVALAALALADQLRGDSQHEALIARWLAAADSRRDPATGLLPHRVDPVTGAAVEGARASSQALALRFLYEVDPHGATSDWLRFRDLFASTVPGVPGFREHPQGNPGAGDVDSGPLILGLSASASVVALGTAVVVGDQATARALSGLAEATGGAVEYGGQRRYLAGTLPVGDAFLAWSVTASSWLVPTGATDPPGGGPAGWWRLPWHLVTAWALAPAWLLALTVTYVRAGSSRRAGPETFGRESLRTF